jgi:hypothetical protein
MLKEDGVWRECCRQLVKTSPNANEVYCDSHFLEQSTVSNLLSIADHFLTFELYEVVFFCCRCTILKQSTAFKKFYQFLHCRRVSAYSLKITNNINIYLWIAFLIDEQLKLQAKLPIVI